MYEAIRFSIVKEAEDTHKQLLTKLKSSRRFAKNMGELSEMAQIRNLHWWTVNMA
jgi:phenylalanine-4-hydroxylase